MELSEELAALIPILQIAFLAIVYIANWKIFEKAGKPGWTGLIPVYNIVVLLEIVGKPWWWILLLLVPFVNIVIAIWTLHLLSLSFGQNAGFTIGLVILTFIFYPLLAFGEYRYQGPAGSETLSKSGA